MRAAGDTLGGRSTSCIRRRGFEFSCLLFRSGFVGCSVIWALIRSTTLPPPSWRMLEHLSIKCDARLHWPSTGQLAQGHLLLLSHPIPALCCPALPFLSSSFL